MKIKDIETRTGITSHNIRFYEKEGLIRPERNILNGYREYTEEDVKILNQIKLLRMIGIPVKSIRDCLSREKELNSILEEHLITLKEEENHIKESQVLCQQLLKMKISKDDLSEDFTEEICENKESYMEQLEVIKKYDRIKYRIFTAKQVLGILCGIFVILYTLYFVWHEYTPYMSSFVKGITIILFLMLVGCVIRIILHNEKSK